MTTEQVLEKIVTILLQNNEQSANLWSILTALRGPDDDNEDLKDATTAVIRYHLFKSDATVYGMVVGPDSEEKCRLRKDLNFSHFEGHARRAFQALGLQWNEVNGFAEKT